MRFGGAGVGGSMASGAVRRRYLSSLGVRLDVLHCYTVHGTHHAAIYPLHRTWIDALVATGNWRAGRGGRWSVARLAGGVLGERSLCVTAFILSWSATWRRRLCPSSSAVARAPCGLRAPASSHSSAEPQRRLAAPTHSAESQRRLTARAAARTTVTTTCTSTTTLATTPASTATTTTTPATPPSCTPLLGPGPSPQPKGLLAWRANLNRRGSIFGLLLPPPHAHI